MANIHPLSVVPLYIECLHGDTALANGTGFIVIFNNKKYLITNWHLLSGRHLETKKILSKNGSIPNKIQIYYHKKNELGTWLPSIEQLLYKDNISIWLEHPLEKNNIDVVALPLVAIPPEAEVYPLDLSLADTDIVISPSEPVSIIGFPYGLSIRGKFPIWKTGHIASDIDLDFANKPILLIDATTKQGMSGSPVISLRRGFYQSSQGGIMQPGEVVKFLGIYSGRLLGEDQNDGKIDISTGMCWKPKVIIEILSRTL